MEIYLDLVVILNIVIDFLLLLGTNRLSGFPPEVGRCAAASVFGGAYAGACLLPAFRFLAGTVWRMAVLLLLSVTAFGCRRTCVKRCGLFLLLSLSLSGIALGFKNVSMLTLVCAGGCVLCLCRIAFGTTVGRKEFASLDISYQNQIVHLTALRDSGNTLRDPITGEPVILISREAASRLLGLSEAELRDPLKTLSQRGIPGMRLIPFRSVGCGSGLMLGMRFLDMKINGRPSPGLVAFAQEGLGSGTYEALVGVE